MAPAFRSPARLTRQLRALSAVAALGCAALLPLLAQAAPPAPVQSQVPGYYRHAVGTLEITALYDGYVDLAPTLFSGLAPDERQRQLARMFIYHDKGVQTAVNAYLVHTGAHLVLVDAGAASCFGPTLGQVPANLKASGYSAEQVDAVLLTHLHADHLCGLLDAQGKPVFPKATVYVAREEAGFWLDEKTAAAAPEGFKPFFKMARDSLAPYQAKGQVKTFALGEQVLPGVKALASTGHTPGHVSYLFSAAAGQQALVWGDLVHAHALQFAKPDISFEYDTNGAQAIASRKAMFEQSAQVGWWVAGAHLPFPGIGHVRQDPQGFAWVPVEFGPIRSDR